MTAGNSSTSTATRCPTCGRRSVARGICSACGGISVVNRQEIIPGTPPTLAIRPNFHVSLTSGQQLGRQLSSSPGTRPRADSPGDSLSFVRGSQISGRVIIIHQAPHEPMDFDPWRWVAMPVWGLLLLITPVVASIIVWRSAGLLAGLGVALVSLIVLRYLFSDRLLQGWHLTAALNGRHIVEPMPVLMARLRLRDEREIQIRLKGQLTGGTLMEGDRIHAFGTWRAGVFRVNRISCERTGATIVPRQPNAFALALAGGCLLLAAVLWIWLSGLPWIQQQAHEFQSSFPHSLPISPPTIRSHYEPADFPYSR